MQGSDADEGLKKKWKIQFLHKVEVLAFRFDCAVCSGIHVCCTRYMCVMKKPDETMQSTERESVDLGCYGQFLTVPD
jgi:hypothetical protein